MDLLGVARLPWTIVRAQHGQNNNNTRQTTVMVTTPPKVKIAAFDKYWDFDTGSERQYTETN